MSWHHSKLNLSSCVGTFLIHLLSNSGDKPALDPVMVAAVQQPSSQCTTSTTTIKTVHLVWHHPLCSDHDMNRWNMDTEGYFAINNNLIFWKSPDNLNMDEWSISMEKSSYKSLWTIKFLGVICIQATSEATVLSWNFAVFNFPGHFVLSWNPEM